MPALPTLTPMPEVIKAENSGGDVDYYLVEVPEPKRLPPYIMEVEDIIEAVNMTFAEATVFKSLIRSCNEREHGKKKEGNDPEGIRDAEKMVYYSGRTLVQRKKKARK